MEHLPPEASSRSKLRSRLLFVLIIFLALGSLLTWKAYELIQKQNELGRLVDEMNRERAEEFTRQMADTYGGKTPQATLAMYIEAVEKGDYELASKYFVEGAREKEVETLRDTAKNKNETFLISSLRRVLVAEGYYSSQGGMYTIENPYFAEFTLYPNGIWKIDYIE